MFEHIFITGCGSSGTCLLREIFKNSRQTSVLLKEGQEYFEGCAPYMPPKEKRIVANLNYWKNPLNYNWKEIKLRWENDWDKNLVKVEKTPTTVQLLERQKYFNNSAFILIVRNGYVVSKYHSTWSISMASKHWANMNRIFLEDSKKLKNFIIIKYEDMINEPESIEEILRNFTGIDDLKIKGVKFKVPCASLRNEPEIAQEVTLEFNKNKLKNLTKEEKEIIKKEAGDMLQYFGYDA